MVDRPSLTTPTHTRDTPRQPSSRGTPTPVTRRRALGASVLFAAGLGLGACGLGLSGSTSSGAAGSSGPVCPVPCGATCCQQGACIDGACCDDNHICGANACCGGDTPCCIASGGMHACGANDCGDLCCGGPESKASCPGPDAGVPAQCVPGCASSADCNGGCCAIRDFAKGFGDCVDPDAGAPHAACICGQDSDCSASDCCGPVLDDGGLPTRTLTCSPSNGQPGPYQCCDSTFRHCSDIYCCVATGGVSYCAPPCSADPQCDGGHCQPFTVPPFDFACPSQNYCGP
jgi:hypothetical protein